MYIYIDTHYVYKYTYIYIHTNKYTYVYTCTHVRQHVDMEGLPDTYIVAHTCSGFIGGLTRKSSYSIV